MVYPYLESWNQFEYHIVVKTKWEMDSKYLKSWMSKELTKILDYDRSGKGSYVSVLEL